MKNKEDYEFIFEDEETTEEPSVSSSSSESFDSSGSSGSSGEAEDDVSLPSDSGDSGLEPEQEELVLKSAIQGSQNTLPAKEPCPVEGFDIETIAERIADAVEFRRFIRHKGR